MDTEGVFLVAERQPVEGARHWDILMLLRQLYMPGFVYPCVGCEVRLAVHKHLYAGALKRVAALHLHDNAAVPALPRPRKGTLILRRIHHTGAVHHLPGRRSLRFAAARYSPQRHDQQYTSYPVFPLHLCRLPLSSVFRGQTFHRLAVLLQKRRTVGTQVDILP